MNEPNQVEWEAPPIPEEIKKTDEAPRMSEAATLGNIFFSPGETFEDLRRKPRFLLAMLLMLLAFSTFNFLFINKIGFENIVKARLDSSSQIQQMPAADKQKLIEQQTGPVFRTISYVLPPIVLIVIFLLGGLIYWLGANAMGGTMTFMRGVSVWVYSSLPPTLVLMGANILVLFLKSADDIDISASQNGLVQANPTFLINAKTMPVLAAVLGTFDVFFIWGWILAAIGLAITGKISKGAAWAIVLLVALLNVGFRVVGALF